MIKSSMSCAAAALIAALSAGAAHAEPLASPPISPTLSGNPEPTTFKAGPLGDIHITGAVTGLGYAQSHRVAGDKKSRADIANAQTFIQKDEGMVQFYLQAGAYSIPTIGVPYGKALDVTDATFGLLPQAYVKLAPSEAFSIQAGKMPTLIGAEYTHTFQNGNIQRGLLWNQENAVNRGVQVNYASGPLSVSVSLNDNFYSKRISYLSALATFKINDSNVLAVAAGTNLSDVARTSSATPLFQNNQDIINVIYTYTSGPLTLSPYFQYTRVAATPSIGIIDKGSTTGVALLGKYSWDNGFSLAARAEYIDSKSGTTNLLYGGGSKAWSLTVTPTYQVGAYFIRGEASYIRASDVVPGFGFGLAGLQRGQTRGLIETGFLF